jgi:hypothetical protein
MSTNRKSPDNSATEFKVGIIKKGNDNNKWVATSSIKVDISL